MTNVDLLNRVQAADGWFVILGLNRGRYASQEIVETRSEFDALVQKYLANNWDVYFGVAKYFYKDTQVRTKDNVQNVKAFWIDLDCGETKAEVNSKTGRPEGYIDQATGLKELQRFCATVGLPKPLLVNSGRGIHAYWPLTESVTKEQWEPVAKRLNQLAVTHDLYVDPSVFEAARVLRVPGTFNFKDNPPKPVELISDGKDVEYDTFKSILGVKEEDLTPKPRKALSALQQAMMDNTLAKFSKIMKRSANGDGCAQLLFQYQNQNDVSEPMWFNALSIAQQCSDRDTAIHKISDKYEGYDYEDTERKASHTKFPQRCSTIENTNPGGCDGCKWKGRIGSPIVLGREVIRPEDPEAEIEVEVKDIPHKPEEKEDTSSKVYKIPAYPHPYFRGKNGGIYYMSKETEEAEPICIYEHDLYIVKRLLDSDPEVGETILMRLHLPMDKVKEFTLPLSTIGVKDKLKEALLVKGVAGLQPQMNALAHMVMISVKEMQYKKGAELMRTQFGWADGDSKFIIGDREISKDGTFHSPPSKATAQMAERMQPRGTLEKWKEVFNLYSTPGLEHNAFAALTAFGAPLLKFTGYSGAIMNVIYKGSGTGKSTTLFMCNSVYGHPETLVSIWKDTMAAKMIRLGIMNNLPFTCDEITNITPADFSTLAYSMSQGRGADRAKSSANELRVNTSTWSTISLCSSNASFYEKLGVHKDSPDGEMMRLLEYQIGYNNIIPPQTAKAMFDHQLKENYGHAGDIYAAYLLGNLEDCINTLLTVQQKIDTEMRLTSRERFWSALIACNIAGGLIARSLGLHNYDMKAIYAWAMGMLKEVRSEITPPANNAGAIVGDFLNRNMRNILVVDDQVDKRNNMQALPVREPWGDLVVRYEPDTKKMFLVSKAFKKDCVESQISYKDTLKELKEKGIFLGSEVKRMSKGMKVSFPGVNALVFDCSSPDFIDVEGLVTSAKEDANREQKL